MNNNIPSDLTSDMSFMQADFSWMNITADLFIALAFILTPICLYVIQSKKPDSPYRPVIIMFVICLPTVALIHAMEIWSALSGDAVLVLVSKFFSALVSMSVAVILIISLKRLPALKGPEELRVLNIALEKKIALQNTVTDTLARTERKLQTFLKQAPDGIMIADGLGVIDYSNDMMNHIFGYLPGELNGKLVLELLPENCRHLLSPKHNDLYTTDGTLWGSAGAECICLRKDGTEFSVEMRVNPISSKGETEVLLSTFRDITDRKVREENALKDLLELAHVSRLSTIGQMATGLAHELNQPLTAISNNLHTSMSIQRQLANPDPELLEMTEENYKSAQHAGDIIKSLRRLVSKDNGHQCPTNINNLVTTTVELIRPDAKNACVTLVLELEPDLPSAIIDQVQIQQVLINLGRNAIEALSSFNPKENERAFIISTQLQTDSSILVKVTDNGPGLTKEIKAGLFTPNLTSKKTGMGLGLSICLSIIEAQNGKLWHEEVLPTGATFSFTLTSTKQITA